VLAKLKITARDLKRFFTSIFLWVIALCELPDRASQCQPPENPPTVGRRSQ
jgi:hypothetical protein